MGKGIDSFLGQADLTSVEEAKKESVVWEKFLLRMPKIWKDNIKENTMISINAYVLEAIKKKMLEDNLI